MVCICLGFTVYKRAELPVFEAAAPKLRADFATVHLGSFGSVREEHGSDDEEEDEDGSEGGASSVVGHAAAKRSVRFA